MFPLKYLQKEKHMTLLTTQGSECESEYWVCLHSQEHPCEVEISQATTFVCKVTVQQIYRNDMYVIHEEFHFWYI